LHSAPILYLIFFLFSFGVLAKIYFSLTKESKEKWGGEGEPFPVFHIGNGSKDSKRELIFMDFYFLSRSSATLFTRH
jgi:hypothetical protein